MLIGPGLQEEVVQVAKQATYALVNFKPHPSTPGCPQTPGGDLTLTLVPTPGVVDIEAEVFRIFVAVAFKGIESHSRLFDVTIYSDILSINVLSNPLIGPGDIVGI